MTVRDDIHGQIVAGLKGAKFPINTPEELSLLFLRVQTPHADQATLQLLQEKQANCLLQQIFRSGMQNRWQTQ